MVPDYVPRMGDYVQATNTKSGHSFTGKVESVNHFVVSIECDKNLHMAARLSKGAWEFSLATLPPVD